MIPFVPVPVEDVLVENVPVEAAPSCASYSIEGSLDAMPVASGLDPMAADLEISATAYLHEGDQPLAGHRVIAVFQMADGVAPIAPVDTLTDADGRVSILLPVGAIGVSFRAESAATGSCPDLAPGDTPVVVVDVPVEMPVASPVEPAGPLPATGRALDLALMAILVVSLGVGTVTLGVRRSTEEPRVISR